LHLKANFWILLCRGFGVAFKPKNLDSSYTLKVLKYNKIWLILAGFQILTFFFNFYKPSQNLIIKFLGLHATPRTLAGQNLKNLK